MDARMVDLMFGGDTLSMKTMNIAGSVAAESTYNVASGAIDAFIENTGILDKIVRKIDHFFWSDVPKDKKDEFFDRKIKEARERK